LWFSYIIDGFANIAEAIVGKYYGVRDRVKFYNAIKIVFKWGFELSLIFILIFYIFGIDIAMFYINSLILWSSFLLFFRGLIQTIQFFLNF